jgi:hypothetical protein
MMRRKFMWSLGGLLLATLSTVPVVAQAGGDAKKPASPPAQAAVTLNGKKITIDYSAPSMRGRKIKGGLIPYGQVWRTGANSATTLKTPVDLKIGDLNVPAGTYTIYSWPTEQDVTLIINKQTGQWGTVYDEKQDLGRTKLTAAGTDGPVETFKIHFEGTNGSQTTLHLTWENWDLSTPVVAQ